MANINAKDLPQDGNITGAEYFVMIDDDLGSKATVSLIAQFVRQPVLNTIAPSYDASSTYSVDDLVNYAGSIYKCTTAISTAEAWNGSHWATVTISEILSIIEDSGLSPEDRVKLDLITVEKHGTITDEGVTGEEDGAIVYRSKQSREVRGYEDKTNVDRVVWFNDSGRDIANQNIGTNLRVKYPVIYNDSVESRYTGSILVTASTEPGNWGWVGIFRGKHTLETDYSSIRQAEVYCYLDAWPDDGDPRRSGGHDSLQGIEFDILKTYDRFNPQHGRYWFFPPGYYTVVLFPGDSYASPLELVYFQVLDAAWRCRAYDNEFYYNPSTQILNVPHIRSNEIPDCPTTDGSYTLKVTVSDGVPTYSWVSE